MPFDIIYEHDGAGVVARASGVLTYADVRAAFDVVWKRPESSRLRYHILDLIEDARLDIGVEGLRQIGLLVPETLRHSPDVRTAIVTKSNMMASVVKMAMVYGQVWGGNPRLRHFWSLPDARAWIAEQCPDLPQGGSEVESPQPTA